MNTETNGAGNDPIDSRLRTAGQRLHTTAPDSVATRQALHRVHEAAASSGSDSRDRQPWMPYAWAAGLTAAAVIGIVAFVARSPQETLREIPADTTPITTPATTPGSTPTSTPSTPTTLDAVAPASTAPATSDPVVAPPQTEPADSNSRSVTREYRVGDCFVMSLDAPDRRIGRAAGCISADDFTADRLYLTLMEDQLYRVSLVPDEFDDAGSPLLTIETFPNWSSSSCDLINAFPPENEPGSEASTLVMELVACTGGEQPVALGSRIPADEGRAPEYFTTGSNQFPGGTELAGPVPVAGLIGVDAYYGSPADGVHCVAVTNLPAGSRWQEQCWGDNGGTGAPPTVTSINGSIVQLDLADESAPTAAVLDPLGLPFTGCSGADLDTLVPGALERSSSSAMFPALRCDDTDGTLGAAPVLLQNGLPDGGLVHFERSDRSAAWVWVDSGTSIAGPTPYSVLPYALWSPWPGDTTAWVSNRFDVSFGGSSGDPAINAAAVAGVLDEEADPEFPANARVLATWPQSGVPNLVVVQEDLGGDDSVVGAVHYVHLEGGPNDYRVADWFTSWICGRGGGPGLCV